MEPNTHTQSAELLHAYVKYKERRKNPANVKDASKLNGNSSTADEAHARYPAPALFAELPPALEIRRPRSREHRRHESRSSFSSTTTDRRSEEGQRSRTSPALDTSLLKTPMIEAFNHSARLLVQQVEELNERIKPLMPSKDTRNVEVVIEHEQVPRKDSKSTQSSSYALPPRATRRKLSDVVEEEEPQPSYREESWETSERRSRSEKNIQELIDKVRNGVHDNHGQHPVGSARMLDSVQKLQHINETLVTHLKKMMSAYNDVRSTLEDVQKTHSTQLSQYDTQIRAKDIDLASLQSRLDQALNQAENQQTRSKDDSSRSQIIEIKLAQALDKIGKLQKENESVKANSARISQQQPESERKLMKRIAELEMDLNQRMDESVINDLKSLLKDKDAQIAMLSQREKDLNKNLLKELPEKPIRHNVNGTLSAQELEMLKITGKLSISENAREQQNRELRDVKQQLEENNWRYERLQKDLERLTKEKDRAYEKIHEVRQENEQLREQERKEVDGKMAVIKEEMEMYKSRMKEAEKVSAKMKVRHEEQNVKHREEDRLLRVRINELMGVNEQYRKQLEQITMELMAIDAVPDHDTSGM